MIGNQWLVRKMAVLALAATVGLTACGGGSGGGGAAVPGAGGGAGGAAGPADNITWIGNTNLAAGAAAGLLVNDPAGSVIIDPGLRATTAGGTATVNADGSFTYDPPLGVENVNDTFTYSTAANAGVLVTIALVEKAVFAMNNFVGVSDGSLDAPFTTLAAAAAASNANDTLFVFRGDGSDLGQDLGVALLAGQKLIGEGFGLTVAGRPAVPAGLAPVVSNVGVGVPGDTPLVAVANGSEVAGIQFNAVANEAILASGVTGFNIHDNVIPNPNREGIRIINVSGTGTVVNNTISGSLREGIDINNVEDQAGNLVVTNNLVASFVVTGNNISTAAQHGIRVQMAGIGTNVILAISGNNSANNVNNGIRISGDGDAVVAADVIGNILDGNGAPDFLADTLTTADMCIELVNNGNGAGTATFTVNNGGGIFQLFENGNDAAAAQVGVIAIAIAGACNVP